MVWTLAFQLQEWLGLMFIQENRVFLFYSPITQNRATSTWTLTNTTSLATCSIFSLCSWDTGVSVLWMGLLLNCPCFDSIRFSSAWARSTKFLLLWYSANEVWHTLSNFKDFSNLARYIWTSGVLSCSASPLSTTNMNSFRSRLVKKYIELCHCQ